MDRTQQAQAINETLGVMWRHLNGVGKAQAVIDWCQENGMDTSSILAQPLAAAMGQQKHWCQGPSDYLDMVYTIAAFLAARP